MGEKSVRLKTEEKTKAYNEVVPVAQQFRRKYIPDNEIIKDTIRVLEEQLGYFILKFPSKDENLSGFHIEKSGVHCIYVNSGHPLGRQFFSAWHECYHAINGQISVSLTDKINKDIEEFKAECFAGCILMPEGIMRQYIIYNSINLDYLSYIDIIKMQHFFGVSYSAMITRLIQLFPQYTHKLQPRYALGKRARKKELEENTLQANCSINLIKPTNDFYVSHKFFENIQFNLKNERISQEKAMSLINLIESMGNKDGY